MLFFFGNRSAWQQCIHVGIIRLNYAEHVTVSDSNPRNYSLMTIIIEGRNYSNFCLQLSRCAHLLSMKNLKFCVKFDRASWKYNSTIYARLICNYEGWIKFLLQTTTTKKKKYPFFALYFLRSIHCFTVLRYLDFLKKIVSVFSRLNDLSRLTKSRD